jgi:hypothetical protein
LPQRRDTRNRRRPGVSSFFALLEPADLKLARMKTIAGPPGASGRIKPPGCEKGRSVPEVTRPAD